MALLFGVGKMLVSLSTVVTNTIPRPTPEQVGPDALGAWLPPVVGRSHGEVVLQVTFLSRCRGDAARILWEEDRRLRA
jgi:hypothetical protein